MAKIYFYIFCYAILLFLIHKMIALNLILLEIVLFLKKIIFQH